MKLMESILSKSPDLTKVIYGIIKVILSSPRLTEQTFK